MHECLKKHGLIYDLMFFFFLFESIGKSFLTDSKIICVALDGDKSFNSFC